MWVWLVPDSTATGLDGMTNGFEMQSDFCFFMLGECGGVGGLIVLKLKLGNMASSRGRGEKVRREA